MQGSSVSQAQGGLCAIKQLLPPYMGLRTGHLTPLKVIIEGVQIGGLEKNQTFGIFAAQINEHNLSKFFEQFPERGGVCNQNY